MTTQIEIWPLKRWALLLAILLQIGVKAQENRLVRILRQIPGIEIHSADSSGFEAFYEIGFPQLLDHRHPEKGTFLQRVIIGHAGYDLPVVMVTEGYSADHVTPYTLEEPTALLGANQVYVEHRFFSKSRPANPDWSCLDEWQTASDYHAIKQTLGQVYTGAWVATGASKGGQTTLAYDVYYPNEMAAYIPYVAPVNMKKIDSRIRHHFTVVGTATDRERILQMQYRWLRDKASIFPEWQKLCKQAGYEFPTLGDLQAYEYSVLEFPFSFWQYTAEPASLPNPDTTDAQKMAIWLINIVPPFWFTPAANAFDAAMYEFYTQLGYYEYDERPFRKYLSRRDYPNDAFLPSGVAAHWDKSYQRKLKKFLASCPEHILFIYGECDPWGATAANLPAGCESTKLVQHLGTHGAQISSLDSNQRAVALQLIEKWVKTPVKP